VQLTTSDGHVLDADVAEPSDAPRGGVVVCHPHPQYGGNRFNTVVGALFRALPESGFLTLRFDFRSGGGDGIAERLDVVAALDALDARVEVPLALTGYSFGAAVALTTEDDRVTAIAALAPPLSMMSVPAPSVPTLVLTPQHDQFSPPDAARAIIETWDDCDFDTIESADHFLTDHTTDVGGRVAAWLAARF
jgi:alpha/beta superfamily hydrolase